MTFQFTCPQGHLLESETNHAGQQSRCPICGTLMIIPQPPPLASAAQTSPHSESQLAPPESHDVPSPATSTGNRADAPGDSAKLDWAAPQVFHIHCPNGHQLETTPDLLGQFALCPVCHAQFQLLEQDSIECKQRRDTEIKMQEARVGRFWLNWAIAIAITVVLGLVCLILLSVIN